MATNTMSSDSDKGSGFYTVPDIQPYRRKNHGDSDGSGEVVENELGLATEDYTSENENTIKKKKREKLFSKEPKEERENGGGDDDDDEDDHRDGCCLMVLTRARGGHRCMCMDMKEVKACRELGLELEHERMTMDMASGQVSFPSGSGLHTTGRDGYSPTSNRPIFNPGDDPKEVKARLKLWAHAVALASSTSR